MLLTILAKTIEPSNDLYLLNGILFFATPLLALGLPLIVLRFIDADVRGAWARGMLTVAFPALIVCVLVSTTVAPNWSEKTYVKGTQNAADLEREAADMQDIILRTLVLCGGTALLIFAGGYANSRLNQREEDE